MKNDNGLYRVLFEQSPDAILVIDPDTSLPVCFNDRLLDLLGYGREEFAAINIAHCEASAPGASSEALLVGVIKCGAGECETMLRDSRGELKNVRVSVHSVEDGGQSCLQMVITDISKKKRAEDRLRLLNDSFLNFGPDFVGNINLITQEVGNFMEATCAMYNRLEGDLLCSVGQWHAPPDFKITDRPAGHICYDVIRRGQRTPLFIAHLDESPYAACDPNVSRYHLKTYAGMPVFWGGVAVGSLCVVYDRDIVPSEADMSFLAMAAAAIAVEEARWRAEEKLREQQSFIGNIIESLDNGLVVIDIDYRIVTANSAYCRHFGLKPDEMIGQRCHEIVYGSELPCFRYGRDCPVQRTLESGQPASLIRQQGEATSSGQVIEIKSFPLRDGAGKIIAVIELTSDITDKLKLEEHERNIEKLESLGILAGGIAHDFNNILTSILGNISLSRFQAHDPAKVLQRLEDAENAAVRAKELTQQLLTFARGGEPVKKVIRIGGLLREAAGFATHGSAVKCDFALADDLCPVRADEGQLSQVIHNLVLNAVQAMPEGGTISIAADNSAPMADGKRMVEISVADTGTGIPKHLLQKIFDPYFTTKQQGSGLGLATSYSIVKKHGGNITVESIMGKGTAFHVSLPADEQGEEPEPVARQELTRGKGRILVMDDEEIVRVITKASLEELGYQAECVENGTEAVELYQRRAAEGTPFTAVIMDLTIPGGVGGKEAIIMLLQIDPKVKAVVSSGYASDPVMANYRDYGFSAVLSKPYRLQEMGEVLGGL